MGVADTMVNDSSSPETMPEWDSLKQINLVFALEDVFGVQFSEKQILEMKSVERIVRAVEEVVPQ
jgi:acyl carrier protein